MTQSCSFLTRHPYSDTLSRLTCNGLGASVKEIEFSIWHVYDLTHATLRLIKDIQKLRTVKSFTAYSGLTGCRNGDLGCEPLA